MTWTVTGERAWTGWPATLRAPAWRRCWWRRSATTLHVSGTDAALLERSTAAWRADPALRWQRAEPSLEDVFILNMRSVGGAGRMSPQLRASFGRFVAILVKEFIQIRRDRLTFAMMFGIPILQLTLFGYAINSDPKDLPTAIRIADQSPFARSLVRALENSGYFRIVRQAASEAETDWLLETGEVQFVLHIPTDFGRDLMRGERPSVLLEADATDPVATGSALAAITAINRRALDHDLTGALADLARRAAALRAAASSAATTRKASRATTSCPACSASC